MYLPIFLVILLINCRFVESNSPIVAAYYQNHSQYRPDFGNRSKFTPTLIDPNILTDIYFSYACFGYITPSVNSDNPHLTGDFTIQPVDGNDQTVLYPQIMALKQKNSKLKIFLSIGGWNFNNPNDPLGVGQHTYRLFSKMVSNVDNRKQFISSTIKYAQRFGFDGIDIDWEYPGDLSRGGSVEDFENFIQFLKECSTAFLEAKPSLLLSFAAAPFVPAGLPKNYQDNPDSYFKWIAKCSTYLNRINIMAYDYHGPFDIPKITGVNAPLNHDTNPKSTYFIAKTLQYYLTNGVPSNKIILGIPTFGHSYDGVQGLNIENNGPGKPFESAGTPGPATRTPGLLAYFEMADMITQKQFQFGADPLTNTAYGYNLYFQKWVSFDNPDTVQLKAKIALDNSLSGVIFWAVDMDEYQWEPKFPNIRRAWNVFYSE